MAGRLHFVAVELKRPAYEGSDRIVVFRQQDTHDRLFHPAPFGVEFDDTDIRQFAPGMGGIHAVTHDKVIRTGKPNVIGRDFRAAPLRFVDHDGDRGAP